MLYVFIACKKHQLLLNMKPIYTVLTTFFFWRQILVRLALTQSHFQTLEINLYTSWDQFVEERAAILEYLR